MVGVSKVALIFPGQGAQRIGMGQEFFNNCPESKKIFDEADSIIKGLSTVIFEGPDEKLTSTAFCQPAILTSSIAAFKAFEHHSKFKSIQVLFTCGLSLGEYSALVAAGALSFGDVLRLVQKRATAIDAADIFPYLWILIKILSFETPSFFVTALIILSLA